MVLIVSQLDLQALSKFNYCQIYLDSPLRENFIIILHFVWESNFSALGK